MSAKERLTEYIDRDETYQDYKKDKLMNASDFDKFCIQHCKDIEEILEENQELKRKLKNKPDTEITLEDNKGNIYTIIQTERVDMQGKLNKSIQQLLKENQELKQKYKETTGESNAEKME